MNILIRISIILALPFFLQKETPIGLKSGNNDTNSYCNARFDFCVNFPSAELPDKLLSDNGDGIILRSPDTDIIVTVSGSWAVSNENTTELYNHFIKEKLEWSPESDIRYSIVMDNYYEVMFALDNRFYYQKLINEGNKQIILQMEAPLYRYDKLTQLRNSITLYFR